MAKNIKILIPAVLFLTRIGDGQGAGDADIFNTRVRINPSPATKGDTVEFTCDFTLVDGHDLHELYWDKRRVEDKRRVGRMLKYDNKNLVSQVYDPYKDKIISDEYLEHVPGGGEWDRRHILRMKVDNCDRALYECLVLNNEKTYLEDYDQQTLEVEANLPVPQMCLMIDGECHTGKVYRENNTTLTVSCSVTESSVEPYLTVKRNGEVIPSTPVTMELDGCLSDTSVETGELVVAAGDETRFRCRAHYGGTEKIIQASVTFIDLGFSFSLVTNNGASVGTTIGIVVGTVVNIIVLAVLLLVLYVRKQRYGLKKAQPSKPAQDRK